MPDATLTGVLLQWGIGGVAIIAEAGVILRLYADNKQLQKDKDALQESRRLDAKDTVEKIEGPLTALAQNTKFIADKLVTAKRGRE